MEALDANKVPHMAEALINLLEGRRVFFHRRIKRRRWDFDSETSGDGCSAARLENCWIYSFVRFFSCLCFSEIVSVNRLRQRHPVSAVALRVHVTVVWLLNSHARSRTERTDARAHVKHIRFSLGSQVPFPVVAGSSGDAIKKKKKKRRKAVELQRGREIMMWDHKAPPELLRVTARRLDERLSCLFLSFRSFILSFCLRKQPSFLFLRADKRSASLINVALLLFNGGS